jgi:hypothetical protein
MQLTYRPPVLVWTRVRVLGDVVHHHSRFYRLIEVPRAAGGALLEELYTLNL